MEVSFEIDTEEMSRITEADLAEFSPPALTATFGRILNLAGGLTMFHPDSGDHTVMGDELEGLIHAVCLAAIPDLLSGRPVTYEFRSDPGSVRLIPEDDRVRVAVDGLDDAWFPLGELSADLIACGERFAAFLRAVHGDDPNWSSTLDRFATATVRARAALAAS